MQPIDEKRDYRRGRKGGPPGSLAWREYQVKLASGRTVRLGFSLADPLHKVTSEVQRGLDALHLGFFVVFDDPDSQEEPMLWFQQATLLTLRSQQGNIAIGHDIRSVLPRYFAVFFDDMKDIAPKLADVRFAIPRTGDRTLH
jgi:hypothetical protein